MPNTLDAKLTTNKFYTQNIFFQIRKKYARDNMMIITFLLLDFMVMQSDFPQTGMKLYALYPRRMNDIKGLVQDLHLNMDLTERHKIKLMAP